MNESKTAFCDPQANFYLSKEDYVPASLLIEGPRNTFKTTLAYDYLMQGLFVNEESHVLIIRFLDHIELREDKKLKSFRISEKCFTKIRDEFKEFYSSVDSNVNREVFDGFAYQDDEYSDNSKRVICSYTCRSNGDKKRFTELIYESGYISPEEFIHILLETIQIYGKPSRIVIDEIGKVGSSYPLLLKSRTSSELFFTALIHIIRNFKIKLLITGSIGEYAKSDEIINKIKTLVDDILTTKKINVFGDNYVTIQGGTLTSSEPLNEVDLSGENVPGVIIPTEKYLFKVDNKKLIGLVGFDTDNVYRPGIDLYLFQENSLQKEYNDELVKLLKYAFSHWETVLSINDDFNITVQSYSGSNTTSFHDSLGILKGKPIRKTVIFSIDEFYSNKEDLRSMLVPIGQDIIDEEFKGINLIKGKYPIYSLPYYDNVLLLVYNSEYNISGKKSKDLTKKEKGQYKTLAFNSWVDFYNQIQTLKAKNPDANAVDYIVDIDETLSCLLLDALYASIKKSDNSELIRNFNKYKNTGKIELGVLLDGLLKPNGNGNKIFSEELLALALIIKMSKKSSVWSGSANNQNINSIEFRKENQGDVLLPNSIFYICWYSQLRELIDCYPDLASKLYPCSLPGSGFTGDWEIALMKGSVSVNLGYEVIKFLCSEKEDYKRFVKGIGLPTNERYYYRSDLDKAIPEVKKLIKEAKYKVIEMAKKMIEVTNTPFKKYETNTAVKKLFMKVKKDYKTIDKLIKEANDEIKRKTRELVAEVDNDISIAKIEINLVYRIMDDNKVIYEIIEKALKKIKKKRNINNEVKVPISNAEAESKKARKEISELEVKIRKAEEQIELVRKLREINIKNISSRFMAWPGSDLQVNNADFKKELPEKSSNELSNELKRLVGDNTPQLFKLYNIHDKAHKRSDILNYLNIRQSLVILFKQLISLDSEEKIKSIIIERMSGIINRFNRKET